MDTKWRYIQRKQQPTKSDLPLIIHLHWCTLEMQVFFPLLKLSQTLATSSHTNLAIWIIRRLENALLLAPREEANLRMCMYKLSLDSHKGAKRGKCDNKGSYFKGWEDTQIQIQPGIPSWNLLTIMILFWLMLIEILIPLALGFYLIPVGPRSKTHECSTKF